LKKKSAGKNGNQVVATDASNGRVGGGAWRGNVPYMRIIMCLTGDDVKALFLARPMAY
jgi:hypothetical protein